MRTLYLLSLVLFSPLALARTECTTADPETWQDRDEFQQELVLQGYEIRQFKVTSGNCYEIYGYDKDKRKVEIYFDPVSGKIVKHEFEDAGSGY